MTTMASTMFYLLVFLIASLVPASWSCFPVEMFDNDFRWVQTISLDKRLYVYVDKDKSDLIRMESEGEQVQRKISMTCLDSYEDNESYMVRVEEVYQPLHFQCIKFQKLTEHVIRLHRTKARVAKKKVHCDKEKYVEDEAVIFADEIPPQACPLTGGYQLIMHQGMAINADCLDTVQTYNPRLQFQCDVSGGGSVLADFGRKCEPNSLTQSQKMRGRHMTKLRCIGSWEETGYSTVLLQMENSEVNVWCLHYKKHPHERSRVNSKGEEFLSAFLTLDGRCSGEAFVNEAVPRNTSMFGSLASYRPGNDLKCTEKGYKQNCQLREDKCFESSECPNDCKRCIKPVETRICQFKNKTQGQWELLDSFDKLSVSIGKKSLKDPSFGEFECRGPVETGLPGDVFPVFQKDIASTCMPYYACAHITHLAPGVLAFNLRSAMRSEYTGAPFSCAQTHASQGHIVPTKLRRTVTLLDTQQLQKVACQIPERTFPSLLDQCRIAVANCEGDCQTLRVDYDEKTCNNSTPSPFNIEKEHICYANIFFQGGVRGIVAKTADRERYLCWILSPTRLFITGAENCNQEAVTRIYDESEAAVSYDPFNAISRPVGASNDGNNENVGVELSPSFISQLALLPFSLLWRVLFL